LARGAVNAVAGHSGKKLGMLERFYTDITATLVLARLFCRRRVAPCRQIRAPVGGTAFAFQHSCKDNDVSRYQPGSLAVREAMMARDPGLGVSRGGSFFHCAGHGDEAVWLWQCYPHVFDAWGMRSAVWGRETARSYHCIRDLYSAEH